MSKVSLVARRPHSFSNEAEVVLRGDERTLTNIVEKLTLYRNLDSDLGEINQNDIQLALDILLKRK